MGEHAGAEVYDFDSHFSLLLHQNVFGFDVRVNDPELFEEGQREQDLYGEGLDVEGIERFEVVALQQLVEVNSQQFSYDANVSAKHNEVFDPKNVLPVFDVLFFDAHQDVDLVEGQVHLFPPCPHDLHGHHLGSLMVVGLDYFSESPSAEPLQQFIAVAHLFVLAPEVPPLDIVFSKSGPDSNVVNCLFVDQFNTLILGEHQLILLDHFFAGEPWQ